MVNEKKKPQAIEIYKWWMEQDPIDFGWREQFAADKGRETLEENIDWSMMDKHLDTPKARSTFQQVCKEVRESISDAAQIPCRNQHDAYLWWYRTRVYTKPVGWMPFKWTHAKLPFKNGMLSIIGVGDLEYRLLQLSLLEYSW